MDDLNIFSPFFPFTVHVIFNWDSPEPFQFFGYLFLMILFNSFVFASLPSPPNNDMIRNLCCGPLLIFPFGFSMVLRHQVFVFRNFAFIEYSSWFIVIHLQVMKVPWGLEHLYTANLFARRSQDDAMISDSAGSTFSKRCWMWASGSGESEVMLRCNYNDFLLF